MVINSKIYYFVLLLVVLFWYSLCDIFTRYNPVALYVKN